MSSLLLLFMFIIFTLTSRVEVEGKIPAIIVFGDSSVDSGNNNVIKTLLKSNFRPYGRDFLAGQPTGRFSNGKVPPDFISQAFGLKPTIPAYLDPAFTIADFATGVCFASAGTGFDNATSDVLLERKGFELTLWILRSEVDKFVDLKTEVIHDGGHCYSNWNTNTTSKRLKPETVTWIAASSF